MIDPFEVKRRVGRVLVKDLVVLDLTRKEVQTALGVRRGAFGEDDLTGDEYSASQRIADLARHAGFEGVLAPSAALRGEFTLVVFPLGVGKLTVQHSRVQRPPRTMRSYIGRIRRKSP